MLKAQGWNLIQLGYPWWEQLPAVINNGSTVLLRYLRLEAAPTRQTPYSLYRSCYPG